MEKFMAKSFTNFGLIKLKRAANHLQTTLPRLTKVRRPRAKPPSSAGVAFISAVMLTLPMQARAYDYEAKLVPFAGNLSPWGGAADPINIQQFIGPQWNASLPPINLSLKACTDVPVVGEVCVGYGADGHASTSGKLGFDFGLNASGGSVQLALPMTVGLNVTPGIRGVSNPVISLPTDGFALEAGGFN